MSEQRRQQLSEEALREIEWEELGFGSWAGSGLTEVDLAEGVYGDRSLHYFAYSYSRAFEVLWDAAWAGRNALEYPMLFAWRHSMELWLKAAIEAVSPEMKPPAGHGLKVLWRKLMEALYDVPPAAVEDVFTKVVLPVVDAIDAHDVQGDRFRYPSDRQWRAYPSTEAALEELYRAHWRVVGYCDAVVTEMAARRDRC